MCKSYFFITIYNNNVAFATKLTPKGAFMLHFATESKSIPKDFLTCVLEHMKELKETCNQIVSFSHEGYIKDEIIDTVNKQIYSLKYSLYANLKTLDDCSPSERLCICPIDSMVKTLKEVEDILYKEISQLLEKYSIRSVDKCFRVYFATMMELYKMTLKHTVNETNDKTVKVSAVRFVSRKN